jgi:hypothetical protein
LICNEEAEGTWNQKVHKGSCELEYKRRKDKAKRLRDKKRVEARKKAGLSKPIHGSGICP